MIFFKNSYGFLWKIHKDFSEIYRVFFTKNHNKEKTDKKSIVPEPSIVFLLELIILQEWTTTSKK